MNRFAATLLTIALALPGAAVGQENDKAKKGNPPPADLPKNATLVTLQTEDGVILVTTYWKPKPETRARREGSKTTPIVIIPNPRGHTQRESYPFAAELAEAGLAVLTFDFRGSGQST